MWPFKKKSAGIHGYVTRCVIISRHGKETEKLFHIDSELNTVHCFLDGYAIIPLEQYDRMHKLMHRAGLRIINECFSMLEELEK